MSKQQSETRDTRVAQALTDEIVSVETLDGLIDEADTASIKAKTAAEVARARAVDPRILDASALACAIENETYDEKYKNAYQQLVAKLEKTQRIAAHAVWLAQANAADAEADAVEAEFTSTYAAFVPAFLALAERVKNVNQTAHHLNTTRLDGRVSVKELVDIAAVIKNVKLPDPAHTDRFLFPPYGVQAVRFDMPVPTLDSRYIAGNWADVQREANEVIMKRARRA